MLLDQYGKPFNEPERSPVSFALMASLLEAARKQVPFLPSPQAQVRAIAKECAKNRPDEPPQETVKFGLSYG